MRISLLKCGTNPRKTRERLGDYDKLFMSLLAQPGQDWDVHDVEHGQFPATLGDYGGVVITGSPAAAYDDVPWVKELLRLTRECHDREIPLLATCFGIQVVAQALGGEVRINPAGWDIGITELELTEAGRAFPALAGAPSPLRILEMHADIAVTAPSDATVLASSPLTPIEIFHIGERLLCVQGHPEMDNGCVAELIEKRLKIGLFTPEFAEQGLASMEHEPHREFLQKWLGDFLREGRLQLAA